jgi:transketolase
MRDAFFAELFHLYRHDRRVLFLTGDLGYKLFDQLRDHDPTRIINCGIREAGMVGYAAGLAKAGLLPFIYSIVPFITLRCLEQIKIDLCYNRNRVVIVGVGGGFAYGPNASTHHGVEDLGLLGSLPGMTVWTPADPVEVRGCVKSAPSLDGPAYLRLGRNQEPVLPELHGAGADIGMPLLIGEPRDGIIVTCGFILDEVMKGVAILNRQGIYPGVVRVSTLRPFPGERLRQFIATGKPVLTVEEHITVGGLGQEVAVLVAREGKGNRFHMLSIPVSFPETCLHREGLLAWAGLDAPAIARAFAHLVVS